MLFLGMAPMSSAVPFNIGNAGVSVARNNYADAAINLAAAIPGLGNIATGTKLASAGIGATIAAVKVEKTVAKGAAGSITGNMTARPAIVLGEGMSSVKTATHTLRSEGIDARWYQAWGKNFDSNNFNLEKSLLRNERWLKSKINANYDFYDIGINPMKIERSPFYELEQRILRENNITPIPLGRP